MANRILHFPSCARSKMAGNNDCDNRSTPITSFKDDRDEIRFRRTSDAASRSSNNTGGTRCAMVASFPKTGASSVATMAKAARTCSLSSSVKLVTRFTNRSATVVWGSLAAGGSSPLRPVVIPGGTMALHWATAAKLNVAAVRTSASGSCNNFSYAGMRESMTSGIGSNAVITLANLEAAVHRTRQDRSSMVATMRGKIR
mmetsp:Transcript_17499/g.25282  ORF Transcript_17499/g.25282 Transcript_17499/m.25282 type:complete len:200 (+) Transcript_17499:632-1231(+)